MVKYLQLWPLKFIKKWRIYLPLGALWFGWELLKDWFFGNTREYIQEHYGELVNWLQLAFEKYYWIPWLFVPFVIIVLLVWSFFEARRESKIKPVLVVKRQERKERESYATLEDLAERPKSSVESTRDGVEDFLDMLKDKFK